MGHFFAPDTKVSPGGTGRDASRSISSRRLADMLADGVRLPRSSHHAKIGTRAVSVGGSTSYTFADIQPKDIHAQTLSQRPLLVPRQIARETTDVPTSMHYGADKLTRHARAVSDDVRGSRNASVQLKQFHSPRAAH